MPEFEVGDVVGHVDEIFLGGAWLPGEGGREAIVAPATGETVAEVAVPSVDQALAAVAAADELGRTGWGSMAVKERIATVRRFCDLLEQRLDDLGRVWAVEAGMPVRYSRILHRFGAVGAWNASLAVAAEALDDKIIAGPMGDVIVRREPAGVVVGILAYNGPLVTMATKVIPALLAGCPVIVKAAPESHLIMRLVAGCAEDAGFPAGTLSIFTGPADTARALTRDARVDLVSLTGGQATARDIIEATATRFARTHLELGGKSAAVILPDADLGQVLRSLVPGATSGTGQVCALLSRVLVPESRHDEVLDALRTAWGRLVIGDPLDPATNIGPLANAAALERTQSFLARAVEEGGTIAFGGGAPEGRDGLWFEPTIVTGVARDSHLARNEVFGPVTAVLTYTDLDDAVALANDTEFGLAASVYTRDRATAYDVASRITAGSVAINGFGPDVTVPWGGRACSGWGREGGAEGIQEFTELKQILVGPGLAD